MKFNDIYNHGGRKMRTYLGCLAALILIYANFAQASNIVEANGVISDVIVYRGQAMVVRTIELDLPEGSSEIIVHRLPDRLITDTLSAAAPENVIISSVRYREKKAGEDTRQEVKDLEAKIEKGRKDQYQTKRDMEIEELMFAKYNRYWDLPNTTGQADQNRPMLQPEAIEKFAGYLEKQTMEWHSKRVKDEFRMQDIEKEMAKLNKELEELRSQIIRFEREAVISVTQGRKGKAAIKLSYIVEGANWLPQYNLRAHQAKGAVSVEYNALVFQTSGEDWNDVTVKLSTAVPAMVAASPEVNPMKVKLGSPGPTMSAAPRSQSLDKSAMAGRTDMYVDLSQQVQMYQTRRQEAASKGKMGEMALNEAAVSNQMLELRADKEEARTIQVQTKKISRVEGVSVTYDIPGRLWVPSKTEQQLVNIASFESKADFVLVSAPILTDYVYVEGEIANDTDTILLAGPASMYRDVEFAGKGQVDLVTKGEKFTAGFGVDSQIRISREFKDKKVDTMFGNRIDRFEYRIAIENYKPAAVKLRLLERIPYTEDTGLEIRDFETNTSLSKDQDYIRTLKDKGILRWDLELAPNTVSDKARIVTYGYTMKYDKGMQIQPARPVGVQRME
jgi:hypothetical protein